VNSPVLTTSWWLYVVGERQTPNRGGSEDNGVAHVTGAKFTVPLPSSRAPTMYTGRG